MFISFEGIDFSGKSTQIRKTKKWIEDQAKSCLVVREPGGNPISEAIRDLLLDNKNEEMLAKTELLLYSASRAQLTEQYIKPALASYDYVICDRFFDSTTVYQGFGRKLDLDFVKALNRFATSNLYPDITFLIDIPVEESYRRRAARKAGEDRIEKAGREFFERIRLAYLELDKTEERIYRLDGMKEEAFIFKQIVEQIKDVESRLKS